MANIENEIHGLAEPFHEQLEGLKNGDILPFEAAKLWAEYGHPIFTACYLVISPELSREEKISTLATAYENDSRIKKRTGEFLLEKSGNDQGLLEQSRISLEKAAAIKQIT